MNQTLREPSGHSCESEVHQTHPQRTRSQALSQVLHIRVGHQPPGHVTDPPLELSDRLVLPEFTQKPTLVRKGVLLVFLWSTVVGVGRDGGGACKVLQAALGLGRSGGIVAPSSKVLVGRDG